MKTLICILIFCLWVLTSCSPIKYFNCENSYSVYVGKGTPIRTFGIEGHQVSEPFPLILESDTIPRTYTVYECAQYNGDSYYVYKGDYFHYLIPKELGFKNREDAIEYAKSNSNENYTPKYSNSASTNILTGPRGGKYHLSPSGKKVYESSKSKSTGTSKSSGRKK